MSVVVYDGKMLAADSMGITGNVKSRNSKIRRLDDGTILAWVGTYVYGELIAQWYENGAHEEDWPSFQQGENWAYLIVADSRGVYYYESEPLCVRVPRLIPSNQNSSGSYSHLAITFKRCM